MQAAPPMDAREEPVATASRGYVFYLLTILLLINIFNFIDRQLPFILIESIKRDLQLTDTQIGVFGGLAFSLLYPFMGLPLARLADRYGRERILAGSLLIWSVLTACTGFAKSFVQLALARVGVSAAEAGATPSAHALIASHFPLHRRGVPLAIFSLGVPLGSMLALIFGGWLDDTVGWRQAFLWLGLPGVLLAIVTILTIKDPDRQARAQRTDVTMWQTIRTLSAKSSFRHLAVAMGAYSMGANAMIVFTPSFLMRSHELTSAGAGLSLGLLYGSAGVIGTLLGGVLADKLGGRDARWRLWAPALGLLAAVPCTLLAWLVTSTSWSLGLLTVPKFSNLLYIAPVFAALQMLVPAKARATASGFLLLFNSLVGMSLGPSIVGMLSDWLTPTLGDQSLRYALLFVPVTQAWAAVHFVLAARSLRQEIDPSQRHAMQESL